MNTMLQAIEDLAQENWEQSRVVEMMWLGGLSAADVAALTNTDESAVGRNLAAARNWLERKLET